MDDDLTELIGRAVTWRNADPDPRTRAEMQLLVDGAASPDRSRRAAAAADLTSRLTGSLQFGTAGLRGALGAGPNRMNRAVVIRAAAGLAAHLLEVVDGTPRVVVGYDARHDSDAFASDTCAVLTAAGCEALLLPAHLPTPVLAFAVRHVDADGGVMVTASHNPPQDNGYKVYLGGRAEPGPGRGAQIVPPADALIAAEIEAAPRAVDVPMARSGWTSPGPRILQAYLTAVRGVVEPGGPRTLDVVLTPLHGVGGGTAVAAFEQAGFAAPYVVPAQAEPDPDFPTVSFPNPEEPGAMDLALAAARERGADLVIANDPDADRCAVAVPCPDGSWRRLSGDEVGVLLGDYVLSRRRSGGTDAAAAEAVVACSIVSSQMLSRIAAAHGVRHAETLTGFKWLARVPGLIYAYEEALGYCVAPDLVRDKDGVSAALLVAEYAARLLGQGRTLLDALDDLARAHGVHATEQWSVRVADLEAIPVMMRRLREHPPVLLAGGEVTSADDLSATGGALPPTDGLRYRTADGLRVIVRPSGTEPKLKCYLEAVVPLPAGGDLPVARALGVARLGAARADLAVALRVPNA